MCKYCGTGLHDWLIYEDVNFGIFGKGCFMTGISDPSPHEKDPEIVTWVDFGECDTDTCASAKINYCPMCGRKLREVTE